MTFYLKYRPQTIDELDLESVRKQINALVSNIENLPHAFLFAGPRGTGKTSAARILAKALNCDGLVKTKNGPEPCNKCESCRAIATSRSMDVIELDAASNRGIDDIRLLRENINLSPSSGRKKVYILDEAHMLTTEASNAFLKTLEEPPEHAIFILATTEPRKLPDTVRSRLTVVEFRKASNEEIKRSLARVIKGENLDVEKGAVEIIAFRADGSLRDAVKILESLSFSGKKITKKMVEDSFVTASFRPDALLSLILEKDVKNALSMVANYSESGGRIKDLIDDLQSLLREKLINEPSAEIMSLIRALFDARANIAKSYSEDLPLELAIVEWANKNLKNIESLPQDDELKSSKKKETFINQLNKKISQKEIDPEIWNRILAESKSKNISLEALLRAAKPLGVSGNTLNIAVYYSFHKERLETEQYRRLFEKVVEDVLEIAPARVVCTLEEPPSNASLTAVGEPSIIKTAEELFGE